MQLVFLDTETTGIDLVKDRLCEVCYSTGGTVRCERFKPPVPMSVKAMSITHITNKMLEDKPVFQGSDFARDLQEALTNGVLVAHNAKYDGAMLEIEGITISHTICTLKVAKFLDPDGQIPEYNLQYLRYHYDLEIEGGAHDAATDVKVLEQVFAVLAKELEKQEGVTGDEATTRMIQISMLPSLVRRFTFGKYNGKLVSDVANVDRGYLDWLLQQKLQSPDRAREEDWIYTLNTYLQR